MQKLPQSSLLSSHIKERLFNDLSREEQMYACNGDNINHSITNKNGDLPQTNYLLGNQAQNSYEYPKEGFIRNQRISSDTLKQYVQRKIRQELSFILNQKQPPAGYGNNCSNILKKRDMMQGELEEKQTINQGVEQKGQGDGSRAKSISDVTNQNAFHLDQQLQNTKNCLTEVNLSSQAYTKYQKHKQKYFQLHKSYQSPLLIPASSPVYDERKQLQNIEGKKQNQRYEESYYKQLTSTNSALLQRSRVNSTGQQYHKQMQLDSDEKPLKIGNRFKQYSQITPSNFYQNIQIQDDPAIIRDPIAEFDRISNKTRASSRKKNFVQKQNSFNINDGNVDNMNEQKNFLYQSHLEGNKTPANRGRVFSVDQTYSKSIEKTRKIQVMTCENKQISKEDSNDSNEQNCSVDYSNISNTQKDNLLQSQIIPKQNKSVDLPQINYQNQIKKLPNNNSQTANKSKSPKLMSQNPSNANQQIFSENSIILDKSPLKRNKKLKIKYPQQLSINKSLPQVENRQIIPSSKFEVLSGFTRLSGDQQYQSTYKSNQDHPLSHNQRMKSYSFIDNIEGESNGISKYSQSQKNGLDNKNQFNDPNGGYNSKEKMHTCIDSSEQPPMNTNFYSGYGDNIIQNNNNNSRSKINCFNNNSNINNNIQYNNIKTIDEEETLHNSLDKSQSQFNQLKKYYYKKYANY